MELNTLDMLVLLKIQVLEVDEWTQTFVANELCVAQSQVHASLKRAEAARLIAPTSKRIFRQGLAEFLIHGVKYAFPPSRGGMTRGIVTAYAAPPLHDLSVQPDTPPPVWAHPDGQWRGYEFEPLDRRAPRAALKDPKLYELLVLVDAIRDGRSREANLAIGILKERLGQNA
jgi:hypothetical protein